MSRSASRSFRLAFVAAVRAWPILVAAALAVASVGCDRNTAPYPGDEAPRQPDLSRIFPAPAEPEPHEHETAMGQQPIAQASSRQGAATSGGPTLSGEIRLGAESAPAGAMLFVIARAAGARGGPPLAVLRVVEPQFPFAFELSQANVMIPSLRFEGEMDVTARLDVDGNAMTRDPRDLEGSAAQARKPGDSGVVIVLEGSAS